ncbi:MAG: hypothetical protein OM95_16555 [Bdellovibrio sp. ArHS]|uniref:HTTM domain-containing protein n=1 Tax=Bdellovibrio sp. ArHS TaxID=1569284 RepID=UPI000583A137|nr:HTTM domain-containing protein [Bdellovibrio sp. ArHS]KHD87068.1 MAG: hypothetical protein OM95_16555 [Bdellovibrio sp. ArHS]
MKLKTLLSKFYDFVFAPQPVHTVALLRIGLGLLLLFNWWMIVTDLDVLYGPQGMISLQTAQQYGNPFRFSLFDYIPHTDKNTFTLAIINLLAVLGVLSGTFTRFSIAVAFVTLVSFHHRNGFILNSADSVLRIFLFFLFFTPSGDLWSVDRFRKKLKGTAPAIPVDKSPWALRLIQLQFCTIYVATVLFKIKGEKWIDGTAIYTATRIDEFVRFPLPLLNDLTMIKLLTWSTLIVEFALGTLVWFKETRYWVLLAGVALHLGIEYTMSIPVFEWAMIVSMSAMIDPKDLARWVQVFKEKKFHLSWRPSWTYFQQKNS